ncbi:MAG: hypothetical protein M0006_14315 [Magnetospirillum sp.]|nr:hypothetical protein [Magnetospirillum sp.]
MLGAKTLAIGGLVATLLATGCDSVYPTTGQILGTLGGTGLGAAIGDITSSTLQATATGAAMGALVGLAIGSFADPPARVKATAATIQAAETGDVGQPVAWSTDKSSGEVIPTGAAYEDHGRSCRPLHQESTSRGDTTSRDVIACGTADGMWEVVDARPGDDGR